MVELGSDLRGPEFASEDGRADVTKDMHGCRDPLAEEGRYAGVEEIGVDFVYVGEDRRRNGTREDVVVGVMELIPMMMHVVLTESDGRSWTVMERYQFVRLSRRFMHWRGVVLSKSDHTVVQEMCCAVRELSLRISEQTM